MADYYDRLGVAHCATSQEIKAAYRALIRRYHPDVYKGNVEDGTRITQQLNEAYEVLSNSMLRSEYDAFLARSQSAAANDQPYANPANPTEEQVWHRHQQNPANAKYQRGKGRHGNLILMKLLYSVVAVGYMFAFLRIPWLSINGEEAVLWDVAAFLFKVRGELSDDNWSVLLISTLFLATFLTVAGQTIKGLLAADDGRTAYREANDIALLTAFGNLLFRAAVYGAAILFQASQIQCTSISMPYLVIGICLVLVLFWGWSGHIRD